MDKMNYIYFNINYIKATTEGYTFSFENKPVWNYSAQAQFILPWDIKNTMSYFILPKGTWEIYQITKPIQQFDISFNKDFLNKNLKIGLHCFDVFNKNEVNALVSSTNLETKFYQKQDSRTFRISLTYNFGDLSLKKENTEINIEKNQSGGGFMK
jgi:GR25 family glycosyltransferase involved in LPS biosynthesis